MAAYAALLRAINVGGTGKLKMEDLRGLCAELGLRDATTYIQSGNVVFRTRLGAAKVGAVLSTALEAQVGKPVGVLVRSAAELLDILEHNPFPDAPPNRVHVFFLDRKPKADVLEGVVIPGREELRTRGREIYVHYPDGQGRSKLKVPMADSGTARNINTVRKLAEMTAALES